MDWAEASELGVLLELGALGVREPNWDGGARDHHVGPHLYAGAVVILSSPV